MEDCGKIFLKLSRSFTEYERRTTQTPSGFLPSVINGAHIVKLYLHGKLLEHQFKNCPAIIEEAGEEFCSTHTPHTLIGGRLTLDEKTCDKKNARNVKIAEIFDKYFSEKE